MRHFFGIILGALLAAALLVGAGWGTHRLGAGFADTAALDLTDQRYLLGLAALLATGLFLGIVLAVPAVSALAAGLPGLALLAWTGAYVMDKPGILDAMPRADTEIGEGVTFLLSSGMYALLGMALLIPLFVPSRWRRYYAEDEEEGTDTQELAHRDSGGYFA